MPYATAQDLIDRFGTAELVQLTNPNGSTVTTAAVDRAIADAGAEIDAYLRPRYALPLAGTSPLLRRHVANLARFFLHQGEGRNPTKEVTDLREQTLAFLKDVSAGRADLGLDTTAQPIQPLALPKGGGVSGAFGNFEGL